MLDTNTMKKTVVAREDEEIACIDLSVEGSVLASVGKDPSIRLYDISRPVESEKPLRILGSELHQNSGSGVHQESSWSLETSTFHSNRLQSVKFSNTSSDLFFTGGWDRAVKVWVTLGLLG